MCSIATNLAGVGASTSLPYVVPIRLVMEDTRAVLIGRAGRFSKCEILAISTVEQIELITRDVPVA